MARKTISIGPDTWEALSALGKFGQSFDDVIKILLEEHNELKEFKSKSEPEAYGNMYEEDPKSGMRRPISLEREKQIKQRRQESQQQSQRLPFDMDKDTVEPSFGMKYVKKQGKINSIVIGIRCLGLEFPKKKHELIKILNDPNDKSLMKALNALRDTTYSKEKLEDSLVEVFNTNEDLKKLYTHPNARLGQVVIINTKEEDEKFQRTMEQNRLVQSTG